MILKSGTTTAATFTGANVVFAGTVDSGAITSTGQIQGTSITDGTATMTGGNLSSIGTIGCGAITSTGNSSMEQLTVDDIVFNGKVITMTGSTDDTVTLTVGTNGTFDIVTTDTEVGAANIGITADGTIDLLGTTVTIYSGGDIVLDADSGDTFFKDNGTTYGSVTNNSGNMILKSGTTTTATFTGANVVFAGTVDSGAITSTGQIQGTSITDGTATMTGGNLSSIGTIGCGAVTSTGNSAWNS